MKTETQKLQDYLDAEKKNGLVDFHVDVNVGPDTTLESVAEEINRMLAAPTVPDLELM